MKKGFTLIEVIISVALFAIIMMAVITIFTREIALQRTAREVQQDVESARFAMNFVTKVLRTSTVRLRDGDTSNSIVAYDFTTDACYWFYFDEGRQALMMSKADAFGSANFLACNENRAGGAGFDSPTALTTGTVSGFFTARSTVKDNPADGTEAYVGWAQINLDIIPARESAPPVYLQSSVTFRDYGNAGLRF